MYLSNLKSAKGLVLPKYINGFLDLEFLHDAEGLQLCDVEDAVILNGLHSAKGLKIPYDFDLDNNLISSITKYKDRLEYSKTLLSILWTYQKKRI